MSLTTDFPEALKAADKALETENNKSSGERNWEMKLGSLKW